MEGSGDQHHPYSTISVAVDVTDNLVNRGVDEDTNSQEAISPQIERTVTQQIVVSEEPTDAQGTGDGAGQIAEQFYTPNESITQNQFSDIIEPFFAPPGAEVSKLTSNITGELPAPEGVKHVRIEGQVTKEVAASQKELTPTEKGTSATSYEQVSTPEIISPKPRRKRSIRKAIISAVLDGPVFKNTFSSFNETKPLPKISGESKQSSQSIPQFNPSSQSTSQFKPSSQPTPQSKPLSQTAADPPRAPMAGYEWVWFPAGYWAEREVIERPKKTVRPPRWIRRSLQESATSSYSTAATTAPPSLNASEVWLKHPNEVLEDMELMEILRDTGPHRSRASTPPGRMTLERETSTPKNIFRKLQQISHGRKASESRSTERKGKEPEFPRPATPPVDLERQTTNTLKGTSHFFAQFLSMKKQKERAMHPLSPTEPSLRPARKRLGLAPWHQNSSGDTVWSATSSIKGMLFGKTPASTPQPGAKLVPAEPEQFFGVELPGSRGAPHRTADYGFPRVPSPLDIPETVEEEFSQLVQSIPSDGSRRTSSIPLLPGQPKTSLATKKGDRGISQTIYRDIPSPSERESFVRELPEHLPASPLCPMSPKHKSVGKGVCPYHSPRVPIRRPGVFMPRESDVCGEGSRSQEQMMGSGSGA